MSRIPAPPPADVLASELMDDPLHASEWIVAMWSAARALEEEVERLKMDVIYLESVVG
jgi:hypothetical protein